LSVRPTALPSAPARSRRSSPGQTPALASWRPPASDGRSSARDPGSGAAGPGSPGRRR